MSAGFFLFRFCGITYIRSFLAPIEGNLAYGKALPIYLIGKYANLRLMNQHKDELLIGYSEYLNS